MFRTICIEFKLATTGYFLDEMPEYEAIDCLRLIDYADRTDQVLARNQLLVSINSMRKTPLTAQELYKLPWDEKYLDKIETQYNEEEAKELHDAASELEHKLNANLVNDEQVDVIEELNKNTE